MSGYRLVAPALLLVLGGCAAGPDYERPELEVPEKYIQPVQQGESFANTPWWELFQDEQLQELIRIALEENQDRSRKTRTSASRRRGSRSFAPCSA
jgi:multidrug efflux system outer membrane protein